MPIQHTAALPSHRRVAVQATVDHQLAPSSPSPMEQGRVLPEFGELAAAAQRQPIPTRDADQKQKAGCSWLSMMMDPEGAAPFKKQDLQQPLSSLESAGTPLGRHSPAPEAAPVMSAGQQAESPHAHEQAVHISAAEPDLPPKKRRHVREMTPPPLSTHHWAPLPMSKPAFEVHRSPAGRARLHEEHEWDAVVPKRQRRHRLVSGDSSSSSSAAAFEHRPVIPAEAPANACLEAHSTPQKSQSDPLCMLLDAAEELSHHEVWVQPANLDPSGFLFLHPQPELQDHFSVLPVRGRVCQALHLNGAAVAAGLCDGPCQQDGVQQRGASQPAGGLGCWRHGCLSLCQEPGHQDVHQWPCHPEGMGAVPHGA